MSCHEVPAIGGDGSFTINMVPPGRYTLQAWHESLGTVQRDAAGDGGVDTITLEMGGK